jgi:hypothetical protein
MLPRREPRKEPAPYYRSKNETRLVPDKYGVFLNPNYTLTDHFNFIGQNLEQTAREFYTIEILNGYTAILDLHTVHDLIRYDPAVSYVEHATTLIPILGLGPTWSRPTS